MIRYVCAFDESNHDLKIRVNEKEEFNFKNQDLFRDTFIGVFVFLKMSHVDNLRRNLEDLKSIYRFQGDELKGTSFLNGTGKRKVNYRAGFSELNELVCKKYMSILKICEENKINTHLTLLSKEQTMYMNFWINVEPFINKNKIRRAIGSYPEKQLFISLMLILTQMDSMRIFGKIYSGNCQQALSIFNDELKNIISNYPNEIKGCIDSGKKTRMQEHLNATKVLRKIMPNRIPKTITPFKDKWVYSRTLEGLNLLLDEKKLDQNKIHFIIDSEENFNKVFTENYTSVECKDSKDDIILALPDFIGYLFSHILDGIERELDLKSDMDEKLLLSNNFFNLKEDQFNLVKYLSKIILPNPPFYTTFIDINSFYVQKMFAYIDVINSFDTYDNFIIEYNTGKMPEFCNSCLLEKEK